MNNKPAPAVAASSSVGGLGIGGVVFVVLLILKLTGNIAMGWFGVITSIIWAPILASISILLIFMIIGVIVMIAAIIMKLFNR